MNDSIDALVLSRLERLERENRRFRRIALALAAGLVTVVGTGFVRPTEDVVKARGFVLVDAEGAELATLGPDGRGDPLFAMNRGKAQVALTASGPGLLLRGPDGKRSAFLGIDTRGRTALELTSEKLVDGVRLGVEKDGSAGVAVLDSEGYPRVKLESLSEGTAIVSVRGPKSSLRGTLGVDADGNASSILLDSTGRRRVGMVVQTDGTPILSLADEATRPRANLTMQFDGTPRLEFLREDGQASHVLP